MRNRENEFMGFLNNTFADVKYAEIFDKRPKNKNSAYKFSICKKDGIDSVKSVVYLMNVVNALEKSNLKFYAEYYMNFGSFVSASLKVEGRRIEIFIDTQLIKD